MQLLTAYRDKHYLQLVLFFSSVYLWKQAFSIPGSAVMVSEKNCGQPFPEFLRRYSAVLFFSWPDRLLSLLVPAIT